jgi:PKHD-type hydroxylase
VILCLQSVLPAPVLDQVRAALAAARFVDGATTAGWHARLVKANRQADAADPRTAAAKTAVLDQLKSNALFQMAVRPRRMGPLLFSRYEPGMDYGTHVDDAIMGEARSDVSFTLFLSAPEDYDGGALVIESTAGEQSFKLPAGALVLYPSTTLHRVEPVTKGARLACAGWAQSLVRRPDRRELLFDLDTARMGLFRQHGKTAEFDLLSKSVANLLRDWAEL